MSAPAGQQGGIVAVGYGGSAAAQLAVRWAAGYAAAAGLNLRVVHAWVWPVFTKNLGPVRGVAGSGLRHSAEAILAEGIELARKAAREAAGAAPPGVQRAVSDNEPERPGPAVDGLMEAGLPAPVLRDAARDARLLVVGSRGLGAVLDQMAGSVCIDLAGSAPCPVMVIRRPQRRAHPVVVGVDASPRSPATVAEAIRLAEVLGAPLHLVHVDPLRGGAREEHGRHTRHHGQELLDRAIDEARGRAPGLEVSGVLREGHGARELLDTADDADVLVLGTHNPAAGPGNTVSAVLHKARCNVLVTR
jgi:nucleotide-binding universal stress UspA family protein